MPNSDSPQGMYTPLPQTMTDSESEEEIHNSNHHHHHHSHQHHQLQNRNNKFPNSFPKGENRAMSGTNSEILTQNYNNLLSDNEDRFPGENHTDADNVAILQSNPKNTNGMSPLRKCCFVFSLLLCVFTVIGFLWLLPCSDNLTCPATTERIKTHNWLRDYEKIEFKGVINVVNGLRGRSKNLIFMYRGDKLFPEFEDNNRKRNGIISLIGSLGQVAWYDEMIDEPSSIDCTLLDVDNNGSPDCLVIDEYGQLGSINPISGQWMWHINLYDADHVKKAVDLLDFPLILPDLNNDGVKDLLLASSLEGNYHNNLIMISGSNGRTIGRAYTVSECYYIHKLQIDSTYMISFNCINNETELSRTKSLADLYNLTTNKSLNLKFLPSPVVIDQHKFYGQRKNTENQRNIYSVSGKQLIVENRGKCPYNCNVTVTLIDQKEGKEHVIKNGSGMYGMVPARLSFNNTGVDSKSFIHGFVIKFWEWNLNDSEFYFKNSRFKRELLEDEEFNIFGNVILRKRSWILPTAETNNDNLVDEHVRKTRAAKNLKNRTENILKSKRRLLKETVVLIVFNSTDTRIINTSQSNVVQFCKEGNENYCQPDLNYQENSLLIADLDQDNSQELVSYYSTFISSDNDKDAWRLITYVQLLRLESELPKLYDIDMKN